MSGAPPPPPPPPPSSAPKAPIPVSNKALLVSITKGTKLKKVPESQKNDRSGLCVGKESSRPGGESRRMSAGPPMNGYSAPVGGDHFSELRNRLGGLNSNSTSSHKPQQQKINNPVSGYNVRSTTQNQPNYQEQNYGGESRPMSMGVQMNESSAPVGGNHLVELRNRLGNALNSNSTSSHKPQQQRINNPVSGYNVRSTTQHQPNYQEQSLPSNNNSSHQFRMPVQPPSKFQPQQQQQQQKNQFPTKSTAPLIGNPGFRKGTQAPQPNQFVNVDNAKPPPPTGRKPSMGGQQQQPTPRPVSHSQGFGSHHVAAKVPPVANRLRPGNNIATNSGLIKKLKNVAPAPPVAPPNRPNSGTTSTGPVNYRNQQQNNNSYGNKGPMTVNRVTSNPPPPVPNNLFSFQTGSHKAAPPPPPCSSNNAGRRFSEVHVSSPGAVPTSNLKQRQHSIVPPPVPMRVSPIIDVDAAVSGSSSKASSSRPLSYNYANNNTVSYRSSISGASGTRPVSTVIDRPPPPPPPSQPFARSAPPPPPPVSRPSRSKFDSKYNFVDESRFPMPRLTV